MLFAAFALYTAAVALWLHRAQAAPHLLYGGVFAQTVLAFLAVIVLSRDQPDVAVYVPTRQTQIQTTFIVTPTPWVVAVLIPALIYVSIPVMLWLQDRLQAMYYPTLTCWLIWPLLIGAFLINAAIVLIVQLLDVTDAGFTLLTALQSAGYTGLVLGLVAIFLLGLISFARRAFEVWR